MKLQYKIWDIPNKQWVNPPYYINQYGDVGVKDMIFMGSDDFEIILSSGLKHHNSFVYEGSIIIYLDAMGIVKFGENLWNGWNVGFYVEWITEPHKNMLRTDLAYWINANSNSITVIGNVQENSEFIKNAEAIINAYKELTK